ncbi:YfiR family protein [Oligoflexia bacterium]|nr:YfiR family protein [Oligoflexia bacterium]
MHRHLTTQWQGVVHTSLISISLFLLLTASVVSAETPKVREGRIKAACLYYLAKFVDWPKQSFVKQDAPMRLCILGQDLLNDHIVDTFKDKTVHGRKVEVSFLPKLVSEDALKACHILYFGSSPPRNMSQLLKHLQNKPHLTVGGNDQIISWGGMVELVREQNRIRIMIDRSIANKAGLSVSSELLSIATLVNE